MESQAHSSANPIGSDHRIDAITMNQDVASKTKYHLTGRHWEK